MGFTDGTGQTAFIMRNGDKMDVIRHQTPGPDHHLVFPAPFGQQFKIGMDNPLHRKKSAGDDYLVG